jgi:hypothetical protein
VVQKFKFHTGDLFLHVDFFVTNLEPPRQAVVRFYNIMQQIEDRDLRELEQTSRASLIPLRSISDGLIKGFPGALLDTHGLANANQRRIKELQKSIIGSSF